MQSNSSSATAVAGLTQAELALASLYLEQTQTLMIGAIRGLSEAQWNFRTPGSWSIAEIATHVAFIQELVLARLRENLPSAPAGPDGRDAAVIDGIILRHFPLRLVKFPAPEFAIPKGGGKLGDEIERITANTRALATILESTPDLRAHVLESPPLKVVTQGEHTLADGYQWILTVSAHTERHAKQIVEMRADPRFPN